MAQQQSQQEPTMEEILASIRRIISEDAEEAPKEQAAPAPVQARAPEPEPVEEEVLELDEVIEPEEEIPQMSAPEPEPPPPPPPPKPAMQARPAPRPRPEPRPVVEEEDLMLVDDDAPRGGLLSQTAASAVASAFGQLHTRQRVADDPNITLEDIVRDMLKPMLQDWLETNLPPLVERLVGEEIERAQRHTRRR